MFILTGKQNHIPTPSGSHRTTVFAFVPDLGLDKIFIYKLDLINGKLIPNDPASFDTKPGAGPRHFTFHPNGTFGFVINELNSTITSLNYDAVKGSFSEIETVSTLPKDFVEPNTCADIHTTPNGQFVYGSNRGHDSIAAFLCKENGTLVFVETESTQGKSPRNFAIDPTGKILLAANQNTDNVVDLLDKSGFRRINTYRISGQNIHARLLKACTCPLRPAHFLKE